MKYYIHCERHLMYHPGCWSCMKLGWSFEWAEQAERQAKWQPPHPSTRAVFDQVPCASV